MSHPPIFKLPKITHINTKARKEFILDCLFIGVGVQMLYATLVEDFKDGVVSLHKNKHRKNIKKIRLLYHELKDKQDLLFSMMSQEDRDTYIHKNNTIIRDRFISDIGMCKDELCLEYVAVAVLRYGLNRKRKYPIYDYLKPFGSFAVSIKVMREVKGAINHEYEKERKVAENFVSKIRY
ncbi:hypothetical protein [Arcobacter arenosus]|uniref:Uncharacterized protein n=1 Tax=Arcobacter arenosus TaxID=2576037 RepID=A0A5R8Y5F8_9BACT|nr:hypothetical protein [Arcobacter arenosus]TLP41071.1 hypothetical protein FDK22_03355 [Arcobacter arenosus]